MEQLSESWLTQERQLAMLEFKFNANIIVKQTDIELSFTITYYSSVHLFILVMTLHRYNGEGDTRTACNQYAGLPCDRYSALAKKKTANSWLVAEFSANEDLRLWSPSTSFWGFYIYLG